MKKQLLIILCGFLIKSISAQVYYKDVAGIFYARCTSCHHTGASMYPYMNYTETAALSAAIEYNLLNNIMPPWSPDTSYTRFQHERIITSSEKQLILNWIAGGSLKGDTTLAPVAPIYSTAYQLSGNADLTLSIGQFTSTAVSSDKYYCFSLPSGLTQDRIIRAFEVVPGNKLIVHHAGISFDSTGTYVSDLSGNCINTPGQLIGTYVPGMSATVFPGQTPLKAGIKLNAGSNVIINLHYPGGSIGEIDSTKIRFYFYPLGTSDVRPIYSSVFLQNWSMSILANTTATYSAYYPSAGTFLPISFSAFSVMPHSHLLCTSIIYYAIKPGIDTIKLVKINKWDFEWQDYYTFNKLVKIPNGYQLYSKHVFDNTVNNPNNPSSPPIDVYSNTGTKDEMLLDAMMFLEYQMGDELIDMKAIMDNDSLFSTSIKDIDSKDFVFNSKAFPNPFYDVITIQYTLKDKADVSIEITDLIGRQITVFNFWKQTEGYHKWDWKGTDQKENIIPAGIYFYKIKANHLTFDGKIIKQN